MKPAQIFFLSASLAFSSPLSQKAIEILKNAYDVDTVKCVDRTCTIENPVETHVNLKTGEAMVFKARKLSIYLPIDVPDSFLHSLNQVESVMTRRCKGLEIKNCRKTLVKLEMTDQARKILTFSTKTVVEDLSSTRNGIPGVSFQKLILSFDTPPAEILKRLSISPSVFALEGALSVTGMKNESAKRLLPVFLYLPGDDAKVRKMLVQADERLFSGVGSLDVDQGLFKFRMKPTDDDFIVQLDISVKSSLFDLDTKADTIFKNLSSLTGLHGRSPAVAILKIGHVRNFVFRIDTSKLFERAEDLGKRDPSYHLEREKLADEIMKMKRPYRDLYGALSGIGDPQMAFEWKNEKNENLLQTLKRFFPDNP